MLSVEDKRTIFGMIQTFGGILAFISLTKIDKIDALISLYPIISFIFGVLLLLAPIMIYHMRARR